MRYEISDKDKERFYEEGKQIIKLKNKGSCELNESIIKVEKRNLTEIENKRIRYTICEYRHNVRLIIKGRNIDKVSKTLEIGVLGEKVKLKLKKAIRYTTNTIAVEYESEWRYKAKRENTGVLKIYEENGIWK